MTAFNYKPLMEEENTGRGSLGQCMLSNKVVRQFGDARTDKEIEIAEYFVRVYKNVEAAIYNERATQYETVFPSQFGCHGYWPTETIHPLHHEWLFFLSFLKKEDLMASCPYPDSMNIFVIEPAGQEE